MRLALLSLLAFLCCVSGDAVACPPGYYPIVGNGLTTCGPRTGPEWNQEAGSTPAQPAQPAGAWHEMWGAVAVTEDGRGFVVKDEPSRNVAELQAVKRCVDRGGVDRCRVLVTFSNQCLAIARKGEGLDYIGYSRGPSEKVAEKLVLEGCRKGVAGTSECRVAWSGCTDSTFIPF